MIRNSSAVAPVSYAAQPSPTRRLTPPASAPLPPVTCPESENSDDAVLRPSLGYLTHVFGQGLSCLLAGGEKSCRIMRGALFYLLNQKKCPLSMTPPRAQTLSMLGAKTVQLKTQDGFNLDGVWAPPRQAGGPAVVLFPGNACVADNLLVQAAWYRRQGFGVLLMSMRGYPGSEGDSAAAGEVGMVYDTAACLDFMLAQGVTHDRIIAHGFSLGGVMAATAGYYYDVHVTLDQTFTDATTIMKKCAKGLGSLAGRMSNKLFPIGKAFKLGSRDTQTDGMSSIGKVKQCKREVFVLTASHDHMMAPQFATQLLAARYGDDNVVKAKRAAVAFGGHCVSFTSDPRATTPYAAFLRECGLLTS